MQACDYAQTSAYSFYRRFIRKYVVLTVPFRGLLRKGAKLIWTDKHEQDFNHLKRVMTTEPITLKYPDWNKEFFLITDAAKNGSGFLICQQDDQSRYRIVCCGGRVWNKHEQNMSASEMGLTSIINAIESHIQFFMSKKFTILTDHASYVYVRNLKFQHGK